nr:MAG TPA: RNA polymerase sigma factor [Caudoviricetes sp.]
MNLNDIKKRLKRLPYSNIRIKSLHHEIISLRYGTVKGQSFDGMPKSPSNDNRTEELNIHVIDKIDEIYKKIEREYQEQDDLIKAIENLSDPIENLVMRLLCIEGLSWNEVQRELRCSRSTIKRARESAIKKMILTELNGTN